MFQTIDDLLNEYSKALEWALSLTKKTGEDNRFIKYLAVIKKEFDIGKSGSTVKNSKLNELKEAGEAQLEARALIDIYSKFKDKKDKYFIQKLSNIFDGEYFASDEPVGTASTARDMQAELIMASKCKNPDIVNFSTHDILYNFENFKFGLEVKRLNSDLVLNAFEGACVQLEKKWSTANYGLVVLGLDRFLVFHERNGIVFSEPLLLPRGSWMVRVNTDQELISFNKAQLRWFHQEYEEKMRAIAIKYPKVSGYLVYTYHPAIVGNPVQLVAAGYSEYILWNSISKKDRKASFERFMNDQFYPDQFIDFSNQSPLQ